MEMLRQGTEIEERDVIGYLQESLSELPLLGLPPKKEIRIRKDLRVLLKESIDHNERFKNALLGLSKEAGNAF